MIKDLIYFIQKPLYQWLTFVALAFILLFIIFRPRQEDTIWVIAGVTYLAFMFVNTVFIWTAESMWSYFFFSLLFSVLYLAAASAMTSVYSEMVDTKGSGESGMIFLVIIYHPFLLLLVVLVKWLVFKLFY